MSVLGLDTAGMSTVFLVCVAVVVFVLGWCCGRVGGAVLARCGVRTRLWWCRPGVAAVWASLVPLVRFGAFPLWWTAVPLVTGWVLVVLSVSDVGVRRLPDVVTLGGGGLVFGAVALAAHLGGGWRLQSGALLGAVLLGVGYGAVRLVTPHALGGGDVKAAVPVGAAVGAVGPLVVPWVATTAAAVSLLLAALTRSRVVPHGPALALPAWLSVSAPVLTDSGGFSA